MIYAILLFMAIVASFVVGAVYGRKAGARALALANKERDQFKAVAEKAINKL